MKYYVELLADFEDTPLGKLYPIDPLTKRFVDEDGLSHGLHMLEDETGYVLEL